MRIAHVRIGKRPRRVTAWFALTAVLLAAACSPTDGGDSLPDLELPDLAETTTLRFDDIDGVAVINLWATWCAPCRRELVEYDEVYRELSPDVPFIGVNIGDRPADAQDFIDELGVTFPQYLDLDGALNEGLGTATLPVTVVTGTDGQISVTHSGPMDAAQLRQAIDEAQSPSP